MCLYHDGTVFALVSSEGRIYLKTKDPSGVLGSDTDQFHNMPYYAIPDDMLDDPSAVCAAADKALDVL